MVKASIFDIKHYAINDGPGIRTTFFFQGCNMRCAWCQNPESQPIQPHIHFDAERCIGCGACRRNCPAIDENGKRLGTRCMRCYACVENCPAKALRLCGREATLEELLQVAERERPFYEASSGGITCSGGECLLQAEFLESFLFACGKRNIHTAVDTCGYVPFSAFEKTMPFTDLYLYDLKVMDERLHRRYTGVSNGVILQNLVKLHEFGKEFIVRVPLIPEITDTQENIAAIGKWLRSKIGVCNVELLQYNSLAQSKYDRPAYFDDGIAGHYTLSGAKPQNAEKMQSLARCMKKEGHHVKTLGLYDAIQD